MSVGAAGAVALRCHRVDGRVSGEGRAVPKTLVGLFVGLLLGALAGALEALRVSSGIALTAVGGSLLMGGMAKGAATGLIAGFAAGRTHSFSPTLLAGVGAALALTLLAWLASHDTGRPHILPAIAIGGVAAVVSLRWGH